jgi:hypothetical protein
MKASRLERVAARKVGANPLNTLLFEAALWYKAARSYCWKAIGN